MTENNEGLVLLLTGTAIANGTHGDLISQLDILGRLEEVAQGHGAESRHQYVSAEKAFKRQFLAYDEEKGYYGGKNGSMLQDRLRASGSYIRREKSQVLSYLPTLQRNPVTLSLNGALAEYNRIEADFLDWVEEKGGPAAAARAARAEVISRMNALKAEVGRAKLAAALDWIEEFSRSRPDASLVIFAVGVEVQKALVEALERHTGEGVVHFGAGLSKDPERAREITEEFQSGKARYAVCSVRAAGVGLTLTAADTVLMVEQDWTPKDADQAEARIHRPGQESDRVEAVTLLAEGTIDDYLYTIIATKRAIFEAALVGEEVEGYEDEGSIQTELLDRLVSARS